MERSDRSNLIASNTCFFGLLRYARNDKSQDRHTMFAMTTLTTYTMTISSAWTGVAPCLGRGNVGSLLRLNAISDLSDRKNVNINLLTHLEYERAVWLTQTENMTVKAAKKQAGQEIFKAFYADYDNENLEDLDLFGTEEGDEILLAISIIMQVGRSEGEFSLALSDLANDIEKDGVWNDSTQKANFADNAFRANLSDIRFNIEKWGISDKVADFEQHIHSFWSNIFGLGVCDDKRQGEITTKTNPYSDFYENKNPGQPVICGV